MRALVAALIAGTVCATATPAEACSCPQITRESIIQYAKTGVGCPYVWGGTCWDPNNKSWKGADCSGYVTKCWQVPSASASTACLSHFYSTDSYYNGSDHWTAIDRSELLLADSLVYRSGGSGHIVLFEAFTSTSGCYKVYEARGTSYGIVYREKCPDSTYKARRRHNLVAAPPPPPANQAPIGVLDKADCTAGIVGWAQDPDAKTAAINVHVYIDGAPGQAGAVGYQLLANQNRADLCAQLGSCNHGFSMPIPAAKRDGKPHSVHVYAIDSGQGGQNPELGGSPRSFTCAPPSPGADAGGPDPKPMEAGAAWPDSGSFYIDGGPPPLLENPDDNRDEHDLTLTGSCACRLGARPAPVPLLALVLLLAALLRRR
jgi:hypothetical protein